MYKIESKIRSSQKGPISVLKYISRKVTKRKVEEVYISYFFFFGRKYIYLTLWQWWWIYDQLGALDMSLSCFQTDLTLIIDTIFLFLITNSQFTIHKDVRLIRKTHVTNRLINRFIKFNFDRVLECSLIRSPLIEVS